MIRLDCAFGRPLDPVEVVWLAVVRQAVIDAKALGRFGDDDREEARAWLRGGEERDKVLILAGLDPGWIDRLLPQLERHWREVDEKIERLRRDGHQSGRWAKPAEAAHSPGLVP